MTTHVMSFTVEEKEVWVRDGLIRQTIRPRSTRKPKKVGDNALLHGWKGVPYRSPWSWRFEKRIREVIPIDIDKIGVRREGLFFKWNMAYPRYLARMDGIIPPTGERLWKVLSELYESDEPMEMDVIRW